MAFCIVEQLGIVALVETLVETVASDRGESAAEHQRFTRKWEIVVRDANRVRRPIQIDLAERERGVNVHTSVDRRLPFRAGRSRAALAHRIRVRCRLEHGERAATRRTVRVGIELSNLRFRVQRALSTRRGRVRSLTHRAGL